MAAGDRRTGESPASQATATDELVMVRGDAAMRVFIHLLMNFLHRTDRERRAFYGTDLDTASIAETVGIATIEADMRDPAFREAFGDYRKVVGAERQRPINALSVAAATGIPRETVRRKLKALVKKGVLAEKDGGYIYKPGHVQDPQRLEAFERGMRDTLQFINDCLKLGPLQLAPKSGRKP
jgi:predicted DNA-binding transcriptional regulator